MEGTLGDIGVLLSVVTLLLVAVTWLTDYFQWRSIRSVNSFLENSRDVGQQFGDWLLHAEKSEDGKEITNLESCARVIGHSIANSFSMGMKGITSGEARVERGVERRIMETLQTPEMKGLLDFCDQAGIDRDLAGTVYHILEKRGYLNQILGNDGHLSSRGSSSW